MSIDRRSPTPLYVQLKEHLLSQITDGLLQAGEALPSERQLCQEYMLSRTTVRQALRELGREGVINIVPGRGAYVTGLRPELTVAVSLAGFTGDIQRTGATPSSRLLSAELTTKPPVAALQALGLPAGAEVVAVERLRLVNNVPLALHIAYLNHKLCPQILQHNLAVISVFELLRDKYGLRIVRAEEQVYAALANRRELELLNLTYPAAVLRATRTTFLDNNAVIEYSLATYCGEWYRLNISLAEPGKYP